MDQSGTRLNKFLATHLGIGRREADNLIAKGRVLVNGKQPILGARLQPNDKVKVNGQELSADSTLERLYVLMHKPAGYVCSKRQQGDVPTIYSLLPDKYKQLKTVGRLDKDSSGVILLTNDGDLAHQLTHPSFAKIKKYEVTLNKSLEPLHHQIINDRGIDLPDGNSKLGLEGQGTDWIVTMREGRNRQIRRTFAALGYNIERLHRTQFGEYSLGELPEGKVKEVG